jgi:hypothetical protein
MNFHEILVFEKACVNIHNFMSLDIFYRIMPWLRQ